LPHPCPLSSLGQFTKPEFILAGKGNIRERGLRPLSNSLPLSNKLTFGIVLSYGFERGFTLKVLPEGTKGVSLGGQNTRKRIKPILDLRA
jgi:hypothetical protein